MKSVSLDNLVKTSTPPNVIKIDVEGAEHFVIAGAKQMIQDHQPIVVMETTNADMVRWFESMGYKVDRIDQGNVLCIPPQWINELSSITASLS